MIRSKTYKKVYQLISSRDRKKSIVLIVLLFFGMLLEAFGIGLILPVLNAILSPDSMKKYRWINDLILNIGLVNNQEIVIFSLSLLIAIYFFKSIYLVSLTFYQNRFIANISSYISNKLFESYLYRNYSFHLDQNSARLIKNLQVEISYFTAFLLGLMILITELAISIAVVFSLFFIETKGTFFIFSVLLIFGSVFYFFSRVKAKKWGEIREKSDNEKSKLITEGLNGVKEIILYGRQSFFKQRLIKLNKQLARVFSNQITLGQIPRYYLEFISIVSLAGFIILMYLENKNNTELISLTGVFVAATFRLLPSVNRIISSLQQLKFYKSSIDVLFNDLNNPISEVLNDDLDHVTYEKEFSINNLHFAYPNTDKKILEHLNLKIKHGEAIGIIGPSGVGKSTLTNIIVGLLRPEEGTISVDSNDIDLSKIHSWRKHIGYVTQQIYLTDDTIRSNIAFGIEPDEIDNSRVEKAAMQAQLHEHIISLPLGYDTIVGERGTQLSGGQQQRIGIARALYNQPSLLILDEATSALDVSTEIEVMKAIQDLKEEITILIITHRLPALYFCDKIYEIADKKLSLKKKDLLSTYE